MSALHEMDLNSNRNFRRLDLKTRISLVQRKRVSNARPKKFSWGYSHVNGPAVWPLHYKAACGSEQSPINIVLNSVKPAVGESASPVGVSWANTSAVLSNNGHTMQWTFEKDAGGVQIGDKFYKLLQFHFHIPSEHFINGESKNIEIHFVHQCPEDKELAVLGFLFSQSRKKTKFLDDIISTRPLTKKGASKKISLVNLSLLDVAGDYVHYGGSLTTPPCSEGVKWFVNSKVQTVTAGQLAWFRKCINHKNARTICELNDRQLCMRQCRRSMRNIRLQRIETNLEEEVKDDREEPIWERVTSIVSEADILQMGATKEDFIKCWKRNSKWNAEELASASKGKLSKEIACVCFKFVDKNGDGSLDKKEIIKLYQYVQVDNALAYQDAQEEFKDNDDNEDGKVSFKEFYENFGNFDAELEGKKENPAAHIGEIVLKDNSISSWGVSIRFNDGWKNWSVIQVLQGEQFSQKRAQVGWKVIAVNGAPLSGNNASSYEALLKRGDACSLTFKTRSFCDALVELAEIITCDSDKRLTIAALSNYGVDLGSSQNLMKSFDDDGNKKITCDEISELFLNPENGDEDIAGVLKTIAFMKRHKSGEPFEWGYGPKNGPAVWHLHNEAACGVEQSPINIALNSVNSAKGKFAPQVKISWENTAAVLSNNGHTMQWTTGKNSGGVHIGSKNYELLQFHFHIPSEHFINGEPKNIEIHFVHQCQEDKELAVLGFLFSKGQVGTRFINDIISTKALTKKGESAKARYVNLNLLDVAGEYIHYAGSLTTPPCSEGVKWFVNSKVQTVTADQLAWFRKCIDHNNARTICKLNDRELCTRNISICPIAE